MDKPFDRDALAVSAAAISAQMQRISASQSFDASERNRRFLKYVVEKTLAGQADLIKGYSVATEVFGRDGSFDPLLDPIVRIEASRLRRSLERYYLTAGVCDPIRIDIPKGSYVPSFVAAMPTPAMPVVADAEPANPADPPPPAAMPRQYTARALAVLGVVALTGLLAGWPNLARLMDAPTASVDGSQGPIVYVEPFYQEGAEADLPGFSDGLTRDIIGALAAFNGLRVVATAASPGQAENTYSGQARSGESAYTLGGGVVISQDGFRVMALLVANDSGRHIWAGDFDAGLDQGTRLETRNSLAQTIAKTVAQPYGAIYANEVGASLAAQPGTLRPYQCVIRFYHYWQSYRRDSYQTVRDCLETVITGHPDYAEAHAALSLAVIDGFRFGFVDGADAQVSLSRATALARQAVDLAPRDVRGYHALSLAYWLSGDVERSLATAEAGLALSPGDTELMADLGYRYCARNLCDKGVPLVREAFARNPAQPSVYRLAFFIDHFTQGRFEAALAEARKIDAPDMIYGHVARAVAEIRMGHRAAADDAVARILAMDPDFADRVVADLERRNIHSDILEMVIAALRDAGLPVRQTAPMERQVRTLQ